MPVKTVLISAFLLSGGFGQTGKKTQGTTASKWIENTVDVSFRSGYLTESQDVILSWIVKNRSGSDIELSFKDSFLKEPARVFLKLKNDQSAIRLAPDELTSSRRSIELLDNLIPEDMPLTFRIWFRNTEKRSGGLFQKKSTWQEILSKE